MASRESVAIAVIGATGSGKSTFINTASGSNSPASKSSGNCTAELQSSTFSLDGRSVLLIDTPGFDDTTQNVLNVLKLISDSFSGLHRQGVRLAGIIYMHCVSGQHMAGSSRHNFHIFRKFCGDTSLRDVLIVGNEWPGEELSDDGGEGHGSATMDELFKSATDKGARMLHHDGSRASAHAILRHLIDRKPTNPPIPGDLADQKTNLARTTAGPDAVRELTSQVENHAKAFGELYQGLGTTSFSKDDKARETLQERAKDSLEKIKHLRYGLEKMASDFTTENSRLEDENRRYKTDFSAQKAEAELRTRLLGEERKARELAEAERGRVEAQLAEERALWERQKMERESLRDHAGPKYDKLFVRGALVFALICMSRFVFDGSTFLQ